MYFICLKSIKKRHEVPISQNCIEFLSAFSQIKLHSNKYFAFESIVLGGTYVLLFYFFFEGGGIIWGQFLYDLMTSACSDLYVFTI